MRIVLAVLAILAGLLIVMVPVVWAASVLDRKELLDEIEARSKDNRAAPDGEQDHGHGPAEP
jgi:hypothetical protein